MLRNLRFALIPAAVFAGALLFGALLPTLPVYAQEGDGCAEDSNTRVTDAKRTEIANVSRVNRGVASSTFSCQDVSGISDSRSQCVTGLCDGGANIRCCVAGTTGARPGAGTTPTPTETGAGGGIGRLVLPACVSDGRCELDDIVQTGVNFANFLFGISGAVFLAIFVYAGVLYLTAGGSTGRVQEAKKKLVQATIGMLLVVGAGVLVTFVHDAFIRGGGGGGGGGADTCASSKPGFQCTNLPEGNLEEEIRSRGCVTGLCPAPRNNVCCPSE